MTRMSIFLNTIDLANFLSLSLSLLLLCIANNNETGVEEVAKRNFFFDVDDFLFADYSCYCSQNLRFFYLHIIIVFAI